MQGGGDNSRGRETTAGGQDDEKREKKKRGREGKTSIYHTGKQVCQRWDRACAKPCVHTGNTFNE
jgi:hypothetical protein